MNNHNMNVVVYNIGQNEITQEFLYQILKKAFKSNNSNRAGLGWAEIRQVNYGNADEYTEDFAVVAFRGSVWLMDKNDFADYMFTFSQLQKGLTMWFNSFDDENYIIDIDKIDTAEANKIIQYSVFESIKYTTGSIKLDQKK